VHRDADDDQGDACQVTDGRDLAQDDQSGSSGGGGQLNPACQLGGGPILTLAADQRAPKSSGSARDDDAQHPEPGMVTCPPHPTMQPWPQ